MFRRVTVEPGLQESPLSILPMDQRQNAVKMRGLLQMQDGSGGRIHRTDWESSRDPEEFVPERSGNHAPGVWNQIGNHVRKLFPATSCFVFIFHIFPSYHLSTGVKQQESHH